MASIKHKTCTKCFIEKQIDKFSVYKRGLFGVKTVCKKCDSIRGKQYNIDNKDRIKASQKQYYIDNKEKRDAYQKEYNIKHRNEINTRNKKYNAKHRDEMNAYYRKYNNHRYKTDMHFKINKNIRTAIRNSLKGNKDGKHWEDIVGYTLIDLKRHLEKQFTEGMTWKNHERYGWHIDHKVPVNAFNFTKPEHEDFKKCWALSNLQPMWSEDNMSKSNKLIKHFQPSLQI